jgi:hypothetical protein
VAEQKFRFSLINRYIKHVKMKGLPNQNINLYAEEPASNAVIDSYGIDKCYEMVAYYVEVSSNPSWRWFAQNAHRIYDAMEQKNKDSEERKLLRKQAKEWLNR